MSTPGYSNDNKPEHSLPPLNETLKQVEQFQAELDRIRAQSDALGELARTLDQVAQEVDDLARAGGKLPSVRLQDAGRSTPGRPQDRQRSGV